MIPELTESELLLLKKRTGSYGPVAFQGIEEIQLNQFWWYMFHFTINYIKNSEWFKKLIIDIEPDPDYVENGDENSTDGPIHLLALHYFFLSHNDLESIYTDDPEFESIKVIVSEVSQFIREKYPENKEIENIYEQNPILKTQTANFLLLNELGIIDFLKDRYPDILIYDHEIGKLLCQIMRYETETEKNSMRTLVRDLRNKPETLKTDKAMNEVNQILIFHKLRELK